jgi:H+-transporting ATPase
MLSVAGHMTIFLTRTRGPFWSIPPARIFWAAVLGTQIVATLIAVYGFLMTPLGWGWAGFVWGYALIWALLSDRVKLLAYRIFDPVKAEPKPDAKPEVKSESKAEPKPEVKTESKPEAKAEPKPGAKDEPKPEATAEMKSDARAKTPSDLTPQIAKRAYELYEERGRRGGHAVQDWLQAEREIRKDESPK